MHKSIAIVFRSRFALYPEDGDDDDDDDGIDDDDVGIIAESLEEEEERCPAGTGIFEPRSDC